MLATTIRVARIPRVMSVIYPNPPGPGARTSAAVHNSTRITIKVASIGMEEEMMQKEEECKENRLM